MGITKQIGVACRGPLSLGHHRNLLPQQHSHRLRHLNAISRTCCWSVTGLAWCIFGQVLPRRLVPPPTLPSTWSPPPLSLPECCPTAREQLAMSEGCCCLPFPLHLRLNTCCGTYRCAGPIPALASVYGDLTSPPMRSVAGNITFSANRTASPVASKVLAFPNLGRSRPLPFRPLTRSWQLLLRSLPSPLQPEPEPRNALWVSAVVCREYPCAYSCPPGKISTSYKTQLCKQSKYYKQ